MAYRNGPKITTDGLVLCLDAAISKSYPGSGTTWYDLSTSKNNGTLTNGPTFTNSNNGILNFDGVNDYVIFTRPSSIITGGSISVSIWAKWITTGTTTSTIQALIDNNHSNSPLQGFVLQDRPDLSKKLTFSSSPNQTGVASTFQVGDGIWRHIVGTNDTSTSKLYIDGVLNNSLSQSGLATVQPNISIGYWQMGSGRYLNGKVAHVSIYSRALTSLEIQQNYNATRGRFGV